MISRAKVARFIEGQLTEPSREPDVRKNYKSHYGVQELRDLMDKIYEGKPTNVEDMLSSEGTYGDYSDRSV